MDITEKRKDIIEKCCDCSRHIILEQLDWKPFSGPGCWVKSIYGCEFTKTEHRYDQAEFPKDCPLERYEE